MAYSCVRVAFEIGHEALRRTKKTPDGFTHDWEIFVRGADNTEIHHFVEKVVFYLHTTFPKPKRAIKEPPYSVKESGYAGFIIPIEIYFKNKDEPKKVRFEYDLDLQPSGPPVKNVLRETFIFPNPPEDLRRRLIKGGGVGVVGSDPGVQLVPTEKAVVVEDGSSKNLAPPLIGKPKLGGADTPKKHKVKEHKIEEPRVSSSFAELFGPPIQKTTKVSPDPKKSSSTSPQILNKLPDKDKQSGKSSRPKDKDGERSSSSKDRPRDHEKSKEKSLSSASKHSSPPSKPTPLPPQPHVKPDKDESRKPSHEDGSKELKSSSVETSRGEKKKKDKRNKDEKAAKKERHKDREHGEKKHLTEKVDKQDKTDKIEKNDKHEKTSTENDRFRKSEKIEKNSIKETKEKENSSNEKSVKDAAKISEKPRGREKEKEKEKDREKDRDKDKEKEKEKEKEKHSRGDRDKEKDKEKQRHKHKKKDKKDKKDDSTGFKDREKDREKLAKKDDVNYKNENKDHEKNGVGFESPASITEIPNRKKSRSPSPIIPSTVPREKPPQRPLKKLLDQLPEHSSSDSELTAPSPDEVADGKSPPSAVKPENSVGTMSKPSGTHKSGSPGASNQKDKSSSKKEKKERKYKEQGEKAEKNDANKKRKRKSSTKAKLDESEPVAKTPRVEEAKQDEEMAKAPDEEVMDVDEKPEAARVEQSKSEDEDDGSGSVKEEFGAPPAPECFTPDYVSQLKDLQHKIMTLEDNTELQRVVQVIAETGQYEITKKTFDFDLCALDRRTVKRLQEFFTASS
ncbi:protein AF-9 isoform X2 [Bacillus rossius redtenbacheri]|uniref:protein AF-9 isoform X2 n=1 Tax=Bacillus rossius redtenbacheri TaxID=93214 RepID=UPI002FDDE5F4